MNASTSTAENARWPRTLSGAAPAPTAAGAAPRRARLASTIAIRIAGVSISASASAMWPPPLTPWRAANAPAVMKVTADTEP